MFTVVVGAVWKLQGFNIELVTFVRIMYVSLFLLVIPTLFRRWYFARRRLVKNEITAEYLSPLGFSPAEVCYLFEGKVRERAVAATIIDLTQKGILTAKKVDGVKRIFVGPRVDSNLKKHEKLILVQASAEEGVSGEDLLSGKVSSSKLKTVKHGAKKTAVMSRIIKSDLIRNGYIQDDFNYKVLLRSLKLAIFLVLTLIVLPLIGVVFFDAINKGSTTFGDVGNFVLFTIIISVVSLIPMFGVTALINIIRGRMTGREWLITPKLGRFWLQVVGFRQYVHLAEKDLLNYRTEKLKKRSKNDILPYSVALGFVKNWRDIIT